MFTYLPRPALVHPDRVSKIKYVRLYPILPIIGHIISEDIKPHKQRNKQTWPQTELRGCVKVEEALQGSPSPIVLYGLCGSKATRTVRIQCRVLRLLPGADVQVNACLPCFFNFISTSSLKNIQPERGGGVCEGQRTRLFLNLCSGEF